MKTNTFKRAVTAAACILAAVTGGVNLSGYSLSGHTWATSSVLYYVNPQNIEGLTQSVILDSLQRAASAWHDQTGANVSLVYAGSTGGSSFGLNYKNEVFFRNTSSSYVAETYWWYDGTNHLVDFDTAFYEGNHAFAPSASACTGQAVALDSMATHELGHALGLDHSGLQAATMYPTMAYCDATPLALDPDDITAVLLAYPAVTAPAPPTAPSQLMVTQSASSPSSSLVVSWTDTASTESGFRVERSTDGVTFGQVAQVGTNVTSWTNTGLNASTTYYYRVYAYNSSGNSPYSLVASAQTQAAPAPSGPPTLSAKGNKTKTTASTDLSWANFTTANVDIYRNGSRITTTANDGSYKDSMRRASGTFQYQACNAGTSTCSNTASVTF